MLFAAAAKDNPFGPGQPNPFDAPGAGGGPDMSGILMMLIPVLVIVGLFSLFMIAAMWKVFTKAGQPGWASLIPIYSNYVLTVGICKKEVLWFILQFVPFVNIIIIIMLIFELAKKFGKSGAFGFGLLVFPMIFFPILAFGSAQYEGAPESGKKRYRSQETEDDNPFANQ